jgi:hypothetical protein
MYVYTSLKDTVIALRMNVAIQAARLPHAAHPRQAAGFHASRAAANFEFEKAPIIGRQKVCSGEQVSRGPSEKENKKNISASGVAACFNHTNAADVGIVPVCIESKVETRDRVYGRWCVTVHEWTNEARFGGVSAAV